MPRLVSLLPLSATIGGLLLAAAAMAQSTETPGAANQDAAADAASPTADWPCEQPLRAKMSMGAMWQGPEPSDQPSWRQVPAVAELVAQIAPRRTPQEEAVAAIRRFAAGHAEPERSEALTELFVGLFETLNHERDDILRGIRRFDRRQDALARRIEEGWKQIGEIDAGASDPKLLEQRLVLQQQVDWDSRIFDDRQRLLPAICEQPRVIEQRAFALSRAIQEALQP